MMKWSVNVGGLDAYDVFNEFAVYTRNIHST